MIQFTDMCGGRTACQPTGGPTHGRWVYTSEYGWVWASDEDWGWVAYHYGRWGWSAQYGWVWVPGDEWGPAWVDWCYSDGYIGWSPMPPDPYWQSGYYYGSFSCANPMYYSRTVYVSESRFAGPGVSAYIVVPSQAAAIAVRAKNVTKYSRSKGRIVNGSIDVAKLQSSTGVQIRPAKTIASSSVVSPRDAIKSGAELRVFRPKIATGVAVYRQIRLDADKQLLDRPIDRLDTSGPARPDLTVPSGPPLGSASPPAGGLGTLSPGAGVGLPSGGQLGGGIGGRWRLWTTLASACPLS